MLSVMEVASMEKANLASYQLRDVSQIRYTQWKDSCYASYFFIRSAHRDLEHVKKY